MLDKEYEIANQILICELCFNICKSIKIIPGRGSDFFPYYYNLNFLKGIITLHSLLLSRDDHELSIDNFISEKKEKFEDENIRKFEHEITFIKENFREVYPISLRHKIAAHIDSGFIHSDFTCAYIEPKLVESYDGIIQKLKKCFFTQCNYSQSDDPLSKIKKQSEFILENLIK